MNQVVDRLKSIVTKTNIMTENNQTDNNKSNPQLSNEPQPNINDSNTSLSTNNSLPGILSQVIQNLNQMITKEIEPEMSKVLIIYYVENYFKFMIFDF